MCSEHAYANAEKLDGHVVGRVMAHLESYGSSRLTVPVETADQHAIEEAELAVTEAQADLDGYLSDTKLRSILGAAKYAETVSNYVTVLNSAQQELERARRAGEARLELLEERWGQWSVSDRHEWLERAIYECTVSKGRQDLSERVYIVLFASEHYAAQDSPVP